VNVYIAGSFDDQTRLRDVARSFEAMGHRVVSSWLNEPPTTLKERTHRFMLAAGAIAICDMREADAIVVYTDKPSTSGGLFFELGYCYGKGHEIIVVGPDMGDNVFFHLSAFRFAADTRDAIELLS
jgi:hypothetical protein